MIFIFNFYFSFEYFIISIWQNEFGIQKNSCTDFLFYKKLIKHLIMMKSGFIQK